MQVSHTESAETGPLEAEGKGRQMCLLVGQVGQLILTGQERFGPGTQPCERQVCTRDVCSDPWFEHVLCVRL